MTYRRLGDIPFVSNYEPNQINPIDARILVDKVENLCSVAWWRTDRQQDTPIYKGMLVTCQDNGNIYEYIGESTMLTTRSVLTMDDWKLFKGNANPVYPLNYGDGSDDMQIGRYRKATIDDWSLYNDVMGGGEDVSSYATPSDGLYVDYKEKDGNSVYMCNEFISIGSCWTDKATSETKRESIADASTQGKSDNGVFIPEYGNGHAGIYIPTSPELSAGMANIPLTLQSPDATGIRLLTGKECYAELKNGSLDINADRVDENLRGGYYLSANDDITLQFGDKLMVYGDAVDGQQGSIEVNYVDDVHVTASKNVECEGQKLECLFNDRIKLVADTNSRIVMEQQHVELHNENNITLMTTESDSSVNIKTKQAHLKSDDIYLWNSDIELPEPEPGTSGVLYSDDCSLGWVPSSEFITFNIENIERYIDVESDELGTDPETTKFYVVSNDVLPDESEGIKETKRGIVSENLYYDCHSNLFATAFYSLSDARRKSDVQSIPVYGNESMLMPRKFRWNDSSCVGYGFIAQELEATPYGELVREDADGTKRVDYNGALTVCIAQLQEEIKRLKDRIEWLERPYNDFYK